MEVGVVQADLCHHLETRSNPSNLKGSLDVAFLTNADSTERIKDSTENRAQGVKRAEQRTESELQLAF